MRIGQTSIVHFGSNVVASIVGFIATVYIARTLGAGVLGTYMLVLAVLAWLKMAGSMGLQRAVKKRISESDQESEFISAGLVLQLCIFAVIAVLVFVAQDPLNEYIGYPASEPIIVLLAASLGLIFVDSTLQGQHKVHLASLLTPIDRTLRSILQIGLLVASFGIVGLLAGYALAMIITVVIGFIFLSFQLTMPSREHVISLYDFAKYSWINNVEGRSFSSMDTIVLGLFVSNSLIGIYEVAWNLVSVLAIFSRSINQAVFPEISSLSASEDLSSASNLINDGLTFVGVFIIPGSVGAALIGSELLLLYGAEFTKGGLVLVVLAIARLIFAYEHNLVNSLNALDHPDRAFRVSALFILTNITLNLILVWRFGWLGAAVATAIASGIGLVVAYYSLSTIVEVPIPIVEIGKQVVAALLMGGTIYGIRLQIDVTLVAAIALVFGGAAVYIASYYAISTRFRETVNRNLPI